MGMGFYRGYIVFCLTALGVKLCTNFVAIRNLTVTFKSVGGGIRWVLILYLLSGGRSELFEQLGSPMN